MTRPLQNLALYLLTGAPLPPGDRVIFLGLLGFTGMMGLGLLIMLPAVVRAAWGWM